MFKNVLCVKLDHINAVRISIRLPWSRKTEILPPPYFSETIFNIIFSILVFSFEIF